MLLFTILDSPLSSFKDLQLLIIFEIPKMASYQEFVKNVTCLRIQRDNSKRIRREFKIQKCSINLFFFD